MRDFNIELEWNISNGNETVDDAPLTKGNNRAARRKATRKANKKLREIPTYTSSVRYTRNGGIIHKGNTYSWHPVWKRMDHRLARHEGKMAIAGFFSDDSEPFDAWADCDGEYSDNNFPTREDGTIDLYTLLKYDEDDDDLGEDVYDTIYDLEQDIAKLRREINLYNDFLGEYNLGKLFETWLAANGKEAHYDR